MTEPVQYPLLPTFIAILLAWSAGCKNCHAVEKFWNSSKQELRQLLPTLPDSDISYETVSKFMRIVTFTELSEFVQYFCEQIEDDVSEFAEQLRALCNKKTRTTTGKNTQNTLEDRSFYNKLYSATLGDTPNGFLLVMDNGKTKATEAKDCIRILSMFDLNGTVITADAIDTPRSVIEAVLAQGGEYCLALKNNPQLLVSAVDKIANKMNYQDIPFYTQSAKEDDGSIDNRILIAIPSVSLPKRVLQDWVKDCQTVFLALTEKNITNGSPIYIDEFSDDAIFSNPDIPSFVPWVLYYGSYIEGDELDIRYFVSSLHCEIPYKVDITEIGHEYMHYHWKPANNLHHVLNMTFNQEHLQTKNRNFVDNIEELDHLASKIIKKSKNKQSRNSQKTINNN